MCRKIFRTRLTFIYIKNLLKLRSSFLSSSGCSCDFAAMETREGQFYIRLIDATLLSY